MRSTFFQWLHGKASGLFVLFAFLPLFSYPQDSLKQSHFVLNGYVKDMQTFIFQDINGEWTVANLVHNRLNFKWFVSSSLTASVELRNRLLAGNILTAYPGYNHSFEADQGIIDLSKNLADQKSWLLNTAIDRVWLQYSAEKFQITAGRQRINWGQTFVWNPNDIFNTYSYFDFDYEEKPGSDAIRVQYYSGPTSVIEFVVKSNERKKATFAGLYRFNKRNYDFQFIGGIADQADLVIGTGWSGQVLKGGFRGELTYFHPLKNLKDTTGIFLASMGYDYTFKNSLFLQVEGLYNGNNQTTNGFMMNPLTNTDMSAKNLFLPGYSMFCSLSYPFTPLVSSSLAGIINPKSKLIFIIPSVNISLKENLELSFTAQILRYTAKTPYGQDLNLIYARLKWSF
jgi:hypothetical protein